jgi:Flp pilus assembly protein TadD
MTFEQIRRQISRPVVAGSAAILLIVGIVAGLAPYRQEVVDYLQVGSERLLVEGLLEEDVSPDEETAEGENVEEAGGEDTPEKTEGARNRSGFKRVMTAPVRLVFGLFRRKKDPLAVRKATKDDLEKMKMIPLQRTRTGSPDVPDLMAGPASPESSPATVAQSAARKLFDEAVQLQDQGKIDAALEKLVAASVLQPDHAETYNLLGICYDQKRQYGTAQAEYAKAIEHDRNNARYLNNLGYSYYLAGNDKVAVKWYRKGLKASPQDRRLHNNLGLALGRRGDYSKAREHFVLAVGESGAHLNLGYILGQQGKYEEAIQHYQVALRGQPGSLPAMSQLAQLYERTGRLREAAQVGEEYRRLAAIQQQKEALVEQQQ